MNAEPPFAPGTVPPSFLARLASAPRALLMLDYDGTLAPFRTERNEAVPYDGLRPLLAELIAEPNTRVAIVSGRAVEDLLPLLGLDPAPEVFGTHGWERFRPESGETRVEALDARTASALDRAGAWVRDAGHGERSERKPASVTLHWRGVAPTDAAQLERDARVAWEPLVREGGALELHAFDGGLELRATGRNKGHAVATLLDEEGRGTCAAAFLGDDRTDEDAFEALGGDGLPVLVRPEWRPTRAECWLRPPEELFRFLQEWLSIRRSGRLIAHER